MSWFRVLRRSLLVVAFVFVCGCGGKDPYERHAISGIVSLDGEPLATGNITFFPEASGAVATGGTIQDGEFTIPKDQGLPTGKYKVSITATTTKGPVPTDPNELMANPPRGHLADPQDLQLRDYVGRRSERVARELIYV
ncbi:MAG: carboxypeptidase-like regulatory domain-containing protein [Planctomycetota bacterium]